LSSSMIDAGNASIVTGVLNILCTVTKIAAKKTEPTSDFCAFLRLCEPQA
jgi:hypothetical protein